MVFCADMNNSLVLPNGQLITTVAM